MTDTQERTDFEAWFKQEVPCESDHWRSPCPDHDSAAKWRVTLLICTHFSLYCTHHTVEFRRYLTKGPSARSVYCEDCDKNYEAGPEQVKITRL